MDFLSNVVQTETPQFVDFALLAINTSNELSVLAAPTTIIRRLTYGTPWLDQDHVLGEATAVGISAACSDQDYIYKTDFEIWRKNKEFERQNILMSQPPLYSIPIGTKTTNITTSHLYSTNIENKCQTPRH